MDTKNYLLVTRNNDGYMNSKVTIHGSFEDAKGVVKLMMKASPRIVKGEIIEGGRDYIGDFRVRPLLVIERDKENNFSEVG